MNQRFLLPCGKGVNVHATSRHNAVSHFLIFDLLGVQQMKYSVH